MNQIPSHSQMPTFIKKESNTKPVLYQHPKPEEMRVSFWSKAKPVIKEMAAIALIGITVASTVLTVRSCSNDVARQHAQALKHQLQSSASSDEAR